MRFSEASAGWYLRSPITGCPAAENWTRIWFWSPVTRVARTSEAPFKERSTT